MPDARSAEDKFTFVCVRCHRPVLASRTWTAREVRCPHCASVQTVPAPGADGKPVHGDAPHLSARRCFNFVCNRCRSVLEAHTGLCGQPGHCPTCDARFIIPFVDPRTGMPVHHPDAADDGQDPTPVHAYAASGEQAPQIIRDADGAAIRCSKCGARNEIDADGCAQCGAPFTLEGAAVDRGWSAGSPGVAAGVLGIVSLPLCMIFVPGVLAIVFAWLQRRATPTGNFSPSALLGAILGTLSLVLGVGFWVARL